MLRYGAHDELSETSDCLNASTGRRRLSIDRLIESPLETIGWDDHRFTLLIDLDTRSPSLQDVTNELCASTLRLMWKSHRLQLAVRSNASVCMIVSSLRAMRDECLPGLLIKVSPCLIESPLHLHALLLRPITLLLRLHAWSPREHVFDGSSIRGARWPRPHHRLPPFGRMMGCAHRCLVLCDEWTPLSIGPRELRRSDAATSRRNKSGDLTT